MARALLVGCGCRGRELGGRLAADGWAVRGTSRSDSGLELIAAAGIEPARADPLHPGTVFDLVADVTVIAWLLGSATGPADDLAAIHGPRLESLLEKLVDTPVRGVVYEARGSVADDLLEAGAALIEAASTRWRIPASIVRADPAEPAAWGRAASAAFGSLLGA